MSDRIPAAAVDGLEYAWVGETQINARDGAGRQALAEAVTDARVGTPVRLRARVYQSGYNRNRWTLTAEDLPTLAPTAEGRPLLYDQHAPEGEIVGRVDRSWYDDSDGWVRQEFSVWGAPALADLTNKIIPQFSVHAQEGEGTRVTCTICGANFDEVASDCYHVPGMLYDGQRANIQFAGDLSLAETTWTYLPAVPGTGLEASSPAASYLDERAQRRAVARARLRAPNHEEIMAETRELEPAAVEAPKVTPDPVARENIELKARLASQQDTIDRLVARVEMLAIERMNEESRRLVRDLRARGKLIGDESLAVELRAKSPEVFDGALALVPDNPAYAIGQKTGSATTDGPSDLNMSIAHDRAKALRAAIAAHPEEDPAKLYIEIRRQADAQRPNVLPIQREV